MKPESLRRKADEKLAKVQEIYALAASEDRALTEDEKSEVEKLKADAANLESQAKDVEAIESQRSAYAASGGRIATANVTEVGAPNWEKDPKRGFESPSQMLSTIIAVEKRKLQTGEIVDKLKSLQFDYPDGGDGYMLPRAFTAGSDEHGVYTNPHGGYLVPTQMLGGVRETMWAGDPTSGMTTSIPMQVPNVEFAARVDKNHSTSVSGGFRVYRTSETQETAASRAEFEKITLRASKLMGLSYATAEILNYSPLSFVAVIEQGMRTEFASKVLDEKMRGTGINEYLGVLNANNPALLSVAKETNQAADTVNYQNLVKMVARLWGSGVWMINRTVLPQLMQMVDPGGRLIWQADARTGSPGTILGIPVIVCEECSTLGDAGDINLINWGEYLEGTLRPIEGASSIHVRFLNDETAFRFTLSNAGGPWWRSVLTPKRGDTLSPFVTLDARA